MERIAFQETTCIPGIPVPSRLRLITENGHYGSCCNLKVGKDLLFFHGIFRRSTGNAGCHCHEA